MATRRRLALFASAAIASAVVPVGFASCTSRAPDGDRSNTVASATQPLWTAGWAPLAGTFDTAGVPALVEGDSGGTDLYVAYGSTLYRKTLTGTAWSTTYSLESVAMGGGVTLSGGIAAALKGGSSVWMAARGSDQATWVRSRALGGSWGAWSSLGGVIPYAAGISAANGNLQVWVSGTDNQIYLNRYTTNWSGWSQKTLPSGVTTTGAAAAVAAGTLSYVAVLGSDNNYWAASYNDATQAFSGWTNYGHGSTGTSGLKPPALSYRSGSVDLWTNGDGKLWQRTGIGGAGTWTDAASKTGNDVVVPSVLAAPAALGTSSGNLHLIVRDTNGSPLYRLWYSSTPTPTVILDPDRSIQATYQGTGLTGCEAIAMWEDVALAIPPNQAGCGANGAVLYDDSNDIGQSPNIEHNIWKGSLDCFRGGGSVVTDAGTPVTCTGSQSDRCALSTSANIYSATGWPTGLTLQGGNPPSGGGFVAADDQLVRMGSSGSTLLAIKGSRPQINAGYTSPNGGYRGSYMTFTSGNCGSTWTPSTVLDPCDTGLGFGTTYCTNNAGLDRPEIAVRSTDPGTVTIPVVGNKSGGLQDTLFYQTTNGGVSWGAAVDSNGTALTITNNGMVFPAWAGDKLFLATPSFDATTCGTQWHPSLKYYDPSTKRISTVQVLLGGTYRSYVSTDCAGFEGAGEYRYTSYSLSPIGQYGTDYFLRMSYPMVDAQGRQFYRIRILHVNAGVGTDLGSVDITSSAGGSALHLTSVYANQLDGAPATSVGLWYWYETDSKYPSWGQARIRACIMRDTDPTCSPFAVSLNGGGATRAFPFPGHPGDYLKGSFLYDPADANGKSLQFLAHWVEFPGNSVWAVHANVVKVQP